MAGRCACASNLVSGAAASGQGCIAVTGAGNASSPFVVGLAPGCLPTKVCTSGSRPLGVEGQTIFETDTGFFRVYHGGFWKLDRPLFTHWQESWDGLAAGAPVTTIWDGGNFVGSLDFPFTMDVEVLGKAYTDVPGSSFSINLYIDEPSGVGIWSPVANNGARFAGESSDLTAVAMRGWKDYAGGGTPHFVIRFDTAGSPNPVNLRLNWHATIWPT